MPYPLDTWRPQRIADALVRRLKLINAGDGYNTTPEVATDFTDPIGQSAGNLPRLMPVRDNWTLDQGAAQSSAGGAGSRGLLRFRDKWFIWGIVQNDSRERIQESVQKLLADVLYALYLDETLQDGSGTSVGVHLIEVVQVEFDGGAIAELGRGFFNLEIDLIWDIVRKSA